MRDAAAAEKAKKPAVAIITEEFRIHGVTIANMEGHSDLKQLIMPYPLEGLPKEDLNRIAEQKYPLLLQMLGARP